ncbi:MAG TPA: methyltransferase domain-containing protein [Lutibacter sp.]
MKIKNKIRKILSISPIDYIRKIKRVIIKDGRRDKNSYEFLFSAKIIKDYLMNTKMPKLQIGCGTNILEDWLNTDLYFSAELNVAKLDAGKQFNFPNETFHFIYSEHVFEHLKFEQAMNMLSESYRVLKPNGYIRFAMPDFNFLIQLYQNKDLSIHSEYIKWAAENFCKKAYNITKDNSTLSVYVISRSLKTI